MNKKGELTSTQIVSWILVIIGFAIVLAALFLFNLGGYTEEELCKLSVLTRATAPTVAQAAVPLKCKTSKICFSESSSVECEDAFHGESDVEAIQLKGSDEQKILQIEEESAKRMYDCWSMMGEGKLDLFGSGWDWVGLDQTKTTCVICSRIAVDKGVSSEILNKVDINTYLRTHQVPGSSLTYLQAFTDKGVNSFAKVSDAPLQTPEQIKSAIGNTGVEDKSGIKEETLKGYSDYSTKGENDVIINREMAFVFMQIKSLTVLEVLKHLGEVGATFAGGAFLTGGGRFVEKLVLTNPYTLGALVVGTIAVGGYGAHNARQGQLTAAAYCGDLTSNKESAEKGCSIVQGINYNAKDINTLCNSLQGGL